MSRRRGAARRCRPPAPVARGLGGWLASRDGRRAVLAVWLVAMVVVSLLFVPGLGAAEPDKGSSTDAPGQNDSGPPGQNKTDNGNADTGPTKTTGTEGNGKASGRGDPPGQADGSSGSDDPRAATDSDGTGSESNQSDGGNETTVTASDLEAGETVTMGVSGETTQSGDVAVGSVSGTSRESGDVTMTVVSDEDSTEFETDDGAEEVGRFSLESESGDEPLDDVSVTFEVSKQRLGVLDADLESITLYAYIDGEWVALETEAVGETATHYVFTADSPHLSSFAVGALRPAYELWSATVDSRRLSAGESVTASARFTNVGSADGVFVAEFVVDGRTVDRQQLTVAAGGTRQATFHWTPDGPGTYELVINGVPAGTVTVTPADGPDDATPVLAQLTGWLADLGPASLLEWADRNGASAVIGPVPSAMVALTA